MKKEDLRLKIELIPQPSWYANLRKRIRRSTWDKLRKKVYANAEYKCQICHRNEKLHCHEIWRFYPRKLHQKLVGFQAVCVDCHFINHFGLAKILALQNSLDLEPLILHFLKVNKVSRCQFEVHEEKAFALWRLRSTKKWQIDFGKWTDLVASEKRIIIQKRRKKKKKL